MLLTSAAVVTIQHCHEPDDAIIAGDALPRGMHVLP
jgi:hypothetical protein